MSAEKHDIKIYIYIKIPVDVYMATKEKMNKLRLKTSFSRVVNLLLMEWLEKGV